MGELRRWALSGAGLALLALAGSAWWGLALSLAAFALASRRPALGLVAWAPALLAVPAPSLVAWQPWLGLAGALLAVMAWWPGRWRSLAPLAGGALAAAALLASPVALTVVASDLATGAQVAALMAGGLVGYAALTRPTA